jgi:hypothetical protein
MPGAQELPVKRIKSVIPALLAAAIAWAVGCAPAHKGERAAEVGDLACTIEPAGVQPEGGLPRGLRLTIRNKSPGAVAFTLPRPMVGQVKPAPSGEETPFPLLALFMKDVAGNEESPLYSDPRARSWPKVKRAVLLAGGTWSAVYPLSDFYLWGPCGPDTGGNFTKYFWRGEKAVSLAAALVFEGGKRLESDAITLHCNFEDWLFRKKG